MKKSELEEQIEFFKNTFTEYNNIENIVSASDGEEKLINSLKQNINRSNINQANAATVCRILAYYQSINEGIKHAFSIMFKNGHIWNVEFSSSERSDRTEGLAARLSKNRSNKNYIIIGDYGATERNRRRQIVDPRYNTLVVSMEEFVDDLLLEIFSYKKDGKTKLKLSESPMAQINGKRGTAWEHCIAECLNKNGTFMPALYKSILGLIKKDEKFTDKDIVSCTARPVGAKKKKKDVEVVVSLADGRTITKYISSKASGQEQVSIHQASADDFIHVLGIKNKNVKDALKLFQAYGNTSGMTAADEAALSNFFSKPKNYQALLDWVFKGQTPGSKVDYLVLHSYECDDRFVCLHTKVYRIADYMKIVKSTVKTGVAFGTGLSWTYKSKTVSGKKVNDIQLKVPLIFE